MDASCELQRGTLYRNSRYWFYVPWYIEKKIDKRVVDNGNPKIQEPKPYSKENYASDEKMSDFYKYLSACKNKPAILSIVPPYEEKYLPQKMTEAYPKMLSDFYDPHTENSLDCLELCNLGNSFDVNISPQQQSIFEKLTRAQAK